MAGSREPTHAGAELPVRGRMNVDKSFGSRHLLETTAPIGNRSLHHQAAGSAVTACRLCSGPCSGWSVDGDPQRSRRMESPLSGRDGNRSLVLEAAPIHSLLVGARVGGNRALVRLRDSLCELGVLRSEGTHGSLASLGHSPEHPGFRVHARFGSGVGDIVSEEQFRPRARLRAHDFTA